MHCDGFHARILAHSNGSLGLWDYQRFVRGGGMASASIPVAVGGRNSGGIVGCHVSGDTDARVLRNGFGQPATGCCGGGKESGGRES